MSEQAVRAALRELGVRPSKGLGQNFLVDSSAVQEIMRFGNPTMHDTIIEVGPGLGALTKGLLSVAPVTVIEIEDSFCRWLSSVYPGLRILHEDVRYVDFSELGSDLVVFGNLPYSFSTDIIFHLLTFSDSIKRAIFLLQREFAARLGASPGSKDYGVLTINCQYKTRVSLGPVIAPESFYPRPEVDSQVVEIEYLSEAPFKATDELLLKRIVAAVFSKRRKKIKNSLVSANLFPGVSSACLTDALVEASISPDARPETVSIESFVALSNILCSRTINPR